MSARKFTVPKFTIFPKITRIKGVQSVLYITNRSSNIFTLFSLPARSIKQAYPRTPVKISVDRTDDVVRGHPKVFWVCDNSGRHSHIATVPPWPMVSIQNFLGLKKGLPKKKKRKQETAMKLTKN